MTENNTNTSNQDYCRNKLHDLEKKIIEVCSGEQVSVVIHVLNKILIDLK